MSTQRTLSLDEQIAVELFGRSVFILHGNPRNVGVTGDSARAVRPYSRDIQTAWRVVEEMKRRGLYLTLEDVAGSWHATLTAASCMDEYRARGSAPQEAICKAALAAVRGEKERQT